MLSYKLQVLPVFGDMHLQASIPAQTDTSTQPCLMNAFVDDAHRYAASEGSEVLAQVSNLETKLREAEHIQQRCPL